LVHTSADQAGIPAVHVPSDDVGLRVVTDHVDILGQALVIVDHLYPRGHHLISILVCCQLGLAIDDTLQLHPGNLLVDGLEGDPEGSLRHTGEGVLGRAEEISLGEVDGDALRDGILGARAEDTILGLEEIHDDLEISGVVTRVGEDQDGIDLDLVEVAGVGRGALLGGEELLQGGDGGVPGVDVVGHDDILEAVLLGDLAALVLLATDDQDSVVVLSQRRHGGVRLDELLGGDGRAEDLGELGAASRFWLAGSVGEEDVGDLDAELIVPVQDLEGAAAFGDQAVTVDEDTINVEGKGHVLGGARLDSRHVLDLGRKDLPAGLDGRHPRSRGAAICQGDGGEARLARLAS